jgi:hypothetical protein
LVGLATLPTQHDLIPVVADGSNENPSLAAAKPLPKTKTPYRHGFSSND